MTDLTSSMSPALTARVAEGLAAWDAGQSSARLWHRDSSLWSGKDEGAWLAWLDSPARFRNETAGYRALLRSLQAAGFTDVVVLGMGGSSLAPWVLSEVVRGTTHGLRLRVVDSTDPGQIRAAERGLELDKTLFILASKSGSTLEPNVLRDYFLAEMRGAVGARAGQHFVAITDPGSQVEQHARDEGYRAIFHGEKQIGGRFSALSPFGLVPAALLGVDLEEFLGGAVGMMDRCGPTALASQNPGVHLGTILGVLALEGRDKVTVAAGAPFGSLGAWLEQLIAESTGKGGKGIIPIAGERVAGPESYGDDRLFVQLRVTSNPDGSLDEKIDRLERAGQPVVRIQVPDANALGAEFYRWEFATAVAATYLKVNPFDQPDVEDAKVQTRSLCADYERTGVLPAEEPVAQGFGLRLFADPVNSAALTAGGGALEVLPLLQAHFRRLKRGDYFALLAYLPMVPPVEARVETLRDLVFSACRVATSVGFGPRFQHSTGQAYKGGPDSGVFLQLTCDDGARDLAVPGHRYTFGIVKAAQARGDFGALAARGRRLLRVHLGEDVEAGLGTLEDLLRKALTR